MRSPRLFASHGHRHRRPRRPVLARASVIAPGTALPAIAIVLLMTMGGAEPQLGVASLVFGLLSVVLVAAVLAGGAAATFRRLPWLARLALVGMVLLPLLQIMPLPPAAWHALPGQGLRQGSLALVGLGESWQPLSLQPVSTAYTAYMAVLATALLLLLTQLSAPAMRQILWLSFGLIVVGILIGVIQVATGGSPQIQPSSSKGALLGFIANKNHMALLVAASMPLAAFLLQESRLRPEHARVAIGGYVAVALVALVTTNSRAGLGLGLVAALVVGLQLVRFGRPLYQFAVFGGILLLAIIVAVSPVFDIVFSRFGDVTDDVRWTFLQRTGPLIARFHVLGAGIGSFQTVYETVEQLRWLTPASLNHIHNDYAELLYEAGLPGLLVLALVVASAGQAALRLRDPATGRARRRAIGMALFVLLLFAAHSLVDYPLRRPACLALFLVALATLYRAVLRPATPAAA